jgi:2-oxoglutarate dehydrogenase E1 component
MGAWPYMCRKLRKSNLNLDVVARREASVTATGFAKRHTTEQQEVVSRAFETNN